MNTPNSRFKPTKSQIDAAETLTLAIANERIIRPLVYKYQARILERHQFQIDPECLSYGEKLGPILNPKHSYMLTDQDFDVFLKECQAAVDESGLKTLKPGNCPLLDAQYALSQAENALMIAMADIPKLESLKDPQAICGDLREKIVEHCLYLLAPYCRRPSAILNPSANIT